VRGFESRQVFLLNLIDYKVYGDYKSLLHKKKSTCADY